MESVTTGWAIYFNKLGLGVPSVIASGAVTSIPSSSVTPINTAVEGVILIFAFPQYNVIGGEKIITRKKKAVTLTCFVLLATVVAIAVSPAASGASTGTERGDPRLSTSASFNPISGVRMTVTYELNGQIIPASGAPGDSTQWKVQLTGGTIRVDGSVKAFTVDETFDVSRDVPLGSEVKIPVALAGAIKVTVKTTATVQNISVTAGKAKTDTSSLDFNSEGSKTFTVMISDDASLGDTIEVSGVEVVPEVEVGFEVSVGVWKKNIAKVPIGVSKMSPTLEGSTTVKKPGPPISPPVIGGIVVAIVVIAGIAYAARR